MQLSIKTRLVLAMNLAVVAVGLAVGWAGVAVTGRSIEQRLVDEPARNAAGIFKTMRLPFSDDMMARLGQIVGAPLAAGPADRPLVTATSLPPAQAEALRRLEKAMIRRALQDCGGNQSSAAERLGLHRNTLRNKLRELGLDG